MILYDAALWLESFFANQYILLSLTTLLVSLRVYLFIRFALFSLSGAKTQKANIFLILFLVSATIVSSSWIVLVSRNLFWPNTDFRPYLFWVRLSWAAIVIQYQVLALFLEKFSGHQKKYSLRQKMLLVISGSFVLFEMVCALYHFNCIKIEDRWIEVLVRRVQSFYVLFILLPWSLGYAIGHLKTKNLPIILKKQLKILVSVFIVPIWIVDVIQGLPVLILPVSLIPIYESHAIMFLSQILKTVTSYYCARKVISLRFLNIQNHVQSLSQFHFVNNFRTILEQLSHATNISELKHIVQRFFKESFAINPSEVAIHIRHETTHQAPEIFELVTETQKKALVIESFINAEHDPLRVRTAQLKLLMYDEIAFSNFYEHSSVNDTILNFLENIGADIFLPIYEGDKMIAYIIVRRHARQGVLYSDVERDEMLIFASYLGNVINLLKNRNLRAMLHHEKTLKEELYFKHQEINQYRESIRSFLRNKKQDDIGIIFYKNRRFVLGNKAANDLMHVNVNVQSGHPLSKVIRAIARQVEEYKEPQRSFAVDKDGNRLVIAGVPSLERNEVIIMVYHPEISDMIKKQIEILRDPTEWDYLLYLETTQSGKLINQLIPGGGERLLNFKIQLLKAALSKKALLVNAADDDLLSTVEIIHHTSLRERLRIMHLTAPAKNHDLSIALFGSNPLFGMHDAEKPILEQLDGKGTLFIRNIHFLEIEAQNQLAEFIKYGFYHCFKSEQVRTSDVRIICFSNQDLSQMAVDGTFSHTLLNELQQTTLIMPTLSQLSDDELNALAEGFTEQALAMQDFKNMLSLNEKEKHKLALTRPVSLHEFKKRVQALLIEKSKNNCLYQEAQFDPAYEISDPQLVEAARLGKHALRDPRLMAILWNKFKSQSKIAIFLDVNRSSVSRRLKDYGLGS